MACVISSCCVSNGNGKSSVVLDRQKEKVVGCREMTGPESVNTVDWAMVISGVILGVTLRHAASVRKKQVGQCESR